MSFVLSVRQAKSLAETYSETKKETFPEIQGRLRWKNS
jgi:hypothetical protein